MTYVKRTVKGNPLTHAEIDGNIDETVTRLGTKLDVSAKATAQEGIAGTDATKYIVSSVLKAVMNQLVASGVLKGEPGAVGPAGASVTGPAGQRGIQGESVSFIGETHTAELEGETVIAMQADITNVPAGNIAVFAGSGIVTGWTKTSNNITLPAGLAAGNSVYIAIFSGPAITALQIMQQNIVNNLTAGGADKTLSAEMGKQIAQTTNSLHTLADGSFYLVDNRGVPCLQVNPFGDLKVYNGFSVAQLAVEKINDLAFVGAKEAGVFSILSKDGVPVLRVHDGQIKVAQPRKDFGEVRLHIQFGQSNSVGVGGTPVLHNVAPSNNVLSFNRTGYNHVEPVTGLYDSGSDVYIDGWGPCREQEGETGVTAMGNMLLQQLNVEGFDVTGTEAKILGFAPGTSGEPIINFVPGSTNYRRMINGVANAVRIAAVSGLTCVVDSISWIQGESDFWGGTPVGNYITMLEAIATTAASDIAALTGQANEPRWLLWQFVSQNERYINSYATRFAIPLAMLELARTKPERYVLAHAPYWLPYVDNLHLSAIGHATKGALQGYIAAQPNGWRGIDVEYFKVSGSAINLRFHVPHGQLKFDTLTVNNPGNYGFKLWNSAGVEKAISAVKLSGRDCVKVVAAAAIQPGDYLTYAMYTAPEPAIGSTGNNATGPVTGNRGCLRDTQGDTITYTVGSNILPLHNFCPLFKINL